MYTCSYALFLKEMLMFKYPYERKYSSSNEQFWVTFPSQDFFPWHFTVNSLTVNIPDISLTCFKFPDISRFSRQVVTLFWASNHHHPIAAKPSIYRQSYAASWRIQTAISPFAKLRWSVGPCQPLCLLCCMKSYRCTKTVTYINYRREI